MDLERSCSPLLPDYKADILRFIESKPNHTVSVVLLRNSLGADAVSVAELMCNENLLDRLYLGQGFRVQAKGRLALREYQLSASYQRRRDLDNEHKHHAQQKRQQDELDKIADSREAQARDFERELELRRETFELNLDRRQARRSWIQFAVNASIAAISFVAGAILDYRTDLIAEAVEWLSSLFH